MSAGKMTAGILGGRGPVQGFFVTGTGTDVGKTAFTAALLRALRGRGVAAQALKPVQTGVRPEQLATSALADGVAYTRAVAGPCGDPALFLFARLAASGGRGGGPAPDGGRLGRGRPGPLAGDGGLPAAGGRGGRHGCAHQ